MANGNFLPQIGMLFLKSTVDRGFFLSRLYANTLLLLWTSLVAQLVKNPPAMQGTWIQSLGWADPLEKGTATHSSILTWRIHSPWGCKESDTTEGT